MSAESVPFASVGVRVVLAPRMKVVAIVTTIGAALASGLVWFYFRRKKSEKTAAAAVTADKGARAKDAGAAPGFASRRPGPSVLPPSKPSSSSLTAHQQQRRRGSTSRSTSGSAVGPFMTHAGMTGQQRPFAFVHAGMENLSESTANFERSIRLLKDSKSANRQEKELLDNLENALESTKRLHKELSKLIERLCPEALDEISIASTLTPMGSQFALYDSSRAARRTLSVLSDDSFQSALDELSFPDVEAPVREPQILPFEELEFYRVGWQKVQDGEVECRCLRTEFVHCSSDDDFLAKLYCIRVALTAIMAESAKREWIAVAGRELLVALLQRANKNPSNLYKAYDAMLEYINTLEDWGPMEDELNYRQVKQINFYDVVLDFILMDAFEDLAHPPASVLAVAQNRFFSDSFKETTLSAVVWSVIKTKRTRLKYSRGFISHFYDISEQVSPTMAWGFLGTDESLRELCYYFKDQVCNFLIDIFSLDRVRYTNAEELADDIYQVCQARMTATQQRLVPVDNDPSSLPPSPTNHVMLVDGDGSKSNGNGLDGAHDDEAEEDD